MVTKHIKFRHLDSDAVYIWVGDLLSKKGGKAQHNFLRHVLNDSCNDFAEHVEGCISISSANKHAYIDKGDGHVPQLNESEGNLKLIAADMYLMPACKALKLCEMWSYIPVEEAALPALWGAITLQAIKDKHIRPAWLNAGRNGDEEQAIQDIEEALKDFDKKKIDLRVRRILRWLLAAGTMKSHRVLYANHCLARAWWIENSAILCFKKLKNEDRLAIFVEEGLVHPRNDKVPKEIVLTQIDVAEALRKIWPELSDYMPVAFNVVEDRGILCDLVLWTAKELKKDKVIGRRAVKDELHLLLKKTSKPKLVERRREGDEPAVIEKFKKSKKAKVKSETKAKEIKVEEVTAESASAEPVEKTEQAAPSEASNQTKHEESSS